MPASKASTDRPINPVGSSQSVASAAATSPPAPGPVRIGQRVKRAGLDGEWLVEALRVNTRTAFLRGPYETGKELRVDEASLDTLTPITDLEPHK